MTLLTIPLSIDFGALALVLIIAAFMPLSAYSFFKFMIPKKEIDYDKSMNDMGIKTSKKVSDFYSPSRYFLPVVFVTLICLLAGISLVLTEQVANSEVKSLLLTGNFVGSEKEGLIHQSLAVLSFSFLGGFIWSAQNIIRRLIAYDLAPDVYYSAGIRIILASVIAIVLSLIIGAESGNLFNTRASLTAIAFLTGMFPERILNYLINIYKQFVSPDELNENILSLYKIEGISMQHRERLSEIGIDNAQNLATASLTQLCIETPFHDRQLLDWIGQAKLLCYVKGNIDNLRNVGIRSVFDFLQGDKSQARINQLAMDADVPAVLLENVCDQVHNDKGIKSLYRFLTGVNTPDDEISSRRQDLKEETGPEPVEVDIAG